jgi:hypothetical protein
MEDVTSSEQHASGLDVDAAPVDDEQLAVDGVPAADLTSAAEESPAAQAVEAEADTAVEEPPAASTVAAASQPPEESAGPSGRIRSSRPVRLIASGALVAAAVAVTVGLLAAGGSKPGSQRGHLTDRSNKVQAVAPSKPGRLLPAGSSKAGSRTPSASATTGATVALQVPATLRPAVARWLKTGGGTAYNLVRNAAGDAAQSGALHLYSQMHYQCVQLAADVHAARAAPAIPAIYIQQAYSIALSALSTAAGECRAAIKITPYGDEDQDIFVNHTKLDQSLANFTFAGKNLYTVSSEIAKLHIR